MSPLPTMIFRDLEPPPGGRARLDLALASARKTTLGGRTRRWMPALAALLVMSLLAPFTSQPPGRDDQARAALESVLGSPADGFESRSAEVVETSRPSAGVRLVVLETTRDAKGS